MKIICPSCSFEREINVDKIPSTATLATCPKCQTKFNFRDAIVSEIKADDDIKESSIGSNLSVKDESISAEQKSGVEKSTENSNEENIKKAEEVDESITSSTGQNSSESQSEKEKTEEELEEEKIKQAHAVYREQMKKIKELEEQGYTIQVMTMVPWEEPDKDKNIFTKFIQTIIRVLFSSPAFFATMFRPLTISKAVLFYIILGLIQYVARMLSFRYTNANIDVADPVIQELVTFMLEPSTFALGLFIAPFVLILQLLILSGVLHAVVKLVEPKSADFSLITRMYAYASAPGILTVIPILGDFVAIPWVIFNVLIACRFTLNMSVPKVILTMFAYVVFLVLLTLVLFSSM